MLVAALMSVLVAMREVRKPERWQWLWSSPRPVPAPKSELSTSPSQSASPPLPAATVAEQHESANAGSVATSADEARQRLWRQLSGGLTNAQREQLASLLRAARRGATVRASDAEAWAELLEQLDGERTAALAPPFATPAGTALSAGADSETQSQLRVEPQPEQQVWEEDRAALLAGIERGEWSEAERQQLAAIQQQLDAFDLQAVRDDMVWRPEERQAWFRILEELQQSHPQQLAARSLGETSHRQLFRQSAEYRGKVVSVRGTVRRAYWVTAPANELGIERYAVLWLQPADEPAEPLAVYALELPPSFPEVAFGKATELNEPVAVTGVYFKRLLYRARGGLHTAPLLVARAPVWLPRPPVSESLTERITHWLGEWFWFAAAAVALILGATAAALAWLASWSSRARVAARWVDPGATPPALADLPATPSIQESLRELAERDQPAE